MAKTPSTTPKDLNEALAMIELLKKEKEDANGVIADLKEQLASATKSIDAKESIVEHGGDKYKVTAQKFNYNGQVHHASELSDNAELLAELVKLGAGFLVKIEE